MGKMVPMAKVGTSSGMHAVANITTMTVPAAKSLPWTSTMNTRGSRSTKATTSSPDRAMAPWAYARARAGRARVATRREAQRLPRPRPTRKHSRMRVKA